MATVNIYDMADTWNDGGTAFTAIKMTVTQSAAASGSLLLDLQHGTSGSETSKFSVTKDGDVYSDDFYGTTFGKSSNTSTRLEIASNDDWEFYSNGNSIIFYDNGVGMSLPSNVRFGFADSTQAKPGYGASTVTDTVLTRKAAANLRLGPADAAALQDNAGQTLSVQSIANGTTADAVGGDFTIQGSAGTGSGAGGSIIFQVAPAGGSGTGQNGFQTALTIGADNTVRIPSTSSFYLDNSELTGIYKFAPSQIGVRVNGTTAVVFGNAFLGFRTSGAPDTILSRDAANTLALRNGANAQTFNIYNTFTDASNYERAQFTWGGSNADQFELDIQASGTGTQRGFRISHGGVRLFEIGDGAGGNATSATQNILIGYNTSLNSTFSEYNVIIGADAGLAPSTGNTDNNTLLGYRSGGKNSTGISNTAVGSSTHLNSSGNYNVAVGFNSLYRGGGGAIANSNNTCVGAYTISNTVAASVNNVAIGSEAGKVVSGGDDNTLVGYQAGVAITSGSNNIIIGSGQDASSATASNEINIGGKYYHNKITGVVAFPTTGELTIATGVVTVTGTYHTVDTEADAASDDLDTISGGVDGQILVIQPADSTRTVVAKDGTGNLQLNGDFSLDNAQDTLTLIYAGALSAWVEISRSDNGA